MSARRRVPVLAAMLCSLAACGAPSAADLQATVDAQVQATIAAQLAAVPTATAVPPTATAVPPTNTPEPTRTPRPTSTALPTKTPAAPTSTATTQPVTADQIFRLAIQQTEERSGLRVEVLQVSIGERTYFENRGVTYPSDWADAPTVGLLTLKVTNTRDDTVTIFADQATVVVNNEQIALADYLSEGRFGDDIGGEILPGVEAVGGMVFPIRRATVPEVNRMIVRINAPYSEGFEALGDDIQFTLDLSDHRIDPAVPGT